MARRAAPARGGTPATVALTALSIPFTLHTYRHDPAAASYGTEAAETLDVEPRRVLKTLLVEADGDTVVAIVPVAAQLDLKALATAVGAKRATMADPSSAERETGFVVGGISPIGQRKRHVTVLDASALQWETVLVSGGRRGLEIELSPADLTAATSAKVAPVAR